LSNDREGEDVKQRLIQPSEVEPFSGYLRPVVVYDGTPEGQHAVTVLGLRAAGLAVIQVHPCPPPTTVKRPRSRIESVPPLMWARGTVHDIPFAANSFDVCFLLDTFSHLLETDRPLREVHRTLKADGYLWMNVLSAQDETFGQGRPIRGGRRAFMLYGQTPFIYYEEEDLQRTLGGLFEIVHGRRIVWEHCGHESFRPYRHRHRGGVYLLRKC
jgi:hypothetical protein